jgi:hypothetical protein
MMDRGDEILAELESIARKLDLPFEIDRRYDVDEKDLPLVVLRTGEEESAPADGAPPVLWDRRWVMRPDFEIYVRVAPSQQRAELARLWGELRSAVRDSRLLRLVATNTLPEMKRSTIASGERADISCLLVEFALTFDRD